MARNSYFLNLEQKYCLIKEFLEKTLKQMNNFAEIHQIFKIIPDIAHEHLISNDIEVYNHNLKQTIHLFEILMLMFLKSENYKELVDNLVRYTSLSKTHSQFLIRDTFNLLHDLEIDISTWRPSITYGIEKFNEEDVKKWKDLFVKLGSYNSIKDYLREINGVGPSDTTIKKRLEQYFGDYHLNFKDWEKRYKRNKKLQKYSEKEEFYWIRLYQKFGSFNKVSNYLQEKYNKAFSSYLIKHRIKRHFNREGWNFNNWYERFKKINPTTFKPVYSNDCVLLWINLFEKFGFISDVIKEYRNQTGNRVSSTTILYRIEKLFEEQGKNFETWYESHRKSTEHGSKEYNKEDIEEWEKLFEKIGTFSGVSHYSKEIMRKDTPLGMSIKRHLKEKFLQEGRNFSEWTIEHYSPNSIRAINIGFFVHFIMEYLFLKSLLRRGKKVFYEISPSNERETIIDNTVVDLDKYPKMICIDYSISRYKNNLFDKLYKNYQSIYRKLIIVALLIDNKINIPQNTKKELKTNACILNKDEFAKFAQFNKDELALYFQSIELTKSAFFNDDTYVMLKALGKKARKDLFNLEKERPIREKDLIEYLRYGTGKDHTYILSDLKFKSLNDFIDS